MQANVVNMFQVALIIFLGGICIYFCYEKDMLMGRNTDLSKQVEVLKQTIAHEPIVIRCSE